MVRCKDAAVTWFHGYANTPSLDLMLSGRVNYKDLRYHRVKDGNHNWYIALDGPIVHFFAEDAKATSYDPQIVGTMGGNITLEDGTEMRTHGGWSSREGVVNIRREELFSNIFDEDLVGISVFDEERGGWGSVGLACVYTFVSFAEIAIKDHLPGVSLNREVRDRNGEVYWTPRPDGDWSANAKPEKDSALDLATNVQYKQLAAREQRLASKGP